MIAFTKASIKIQVRQVVITVQKQGENGLVTQQKKFAVKVVVPEESVVQRSTAAAVVVKIASYRRNGARVCMGPPAKPAQSDIRDVVASDHLALHAGG